MSNPTAVRVIQQDGTLLVSRALSMPAGGKASAWTMGVGPLGFRVWHSGVVDVDGGVANAPEGLGILRYSRIEIVYDTPPRILPRRGWSVSDNTLTIGGTPGGDCLAPRMNFRIRTARQYSGSRVTDAFQIGRVGVTLPLCMRGLDAWRHDRILNALASGAQDSYGADMWTKNLGPYHPMGETIAGEGGGFGIEPVSGWNGDALLDILRADLVLERNHLSCVDYQTGEPLPTSMVKCPNYSLSRGLFKPGELDDFTVAFDPANPYDDRRKYKVFNPGSCAYENGICGTDFYSDFQAANGEHLIRAMKDARAAAQIWGDEPSKQTLRMIAADCRYANTWKQVPAHGHGQGHEILGRRESAWVAIATGWRELGQALSDVTIEAIGIAQNCHGPWAGWIPNPGVPQTTIEYGTGAQIHWAPCDSTAGEFQLYENVMTMHAHTLFGNTHIAQNSQAALYDGANALAKKGYLPKFATVSKNGMLVDEITEGQFWPDYTPLLGLGLVAAIDPGRWIPHMLDISTPTQGKAHSLPELKAKLIADLTGRSQVVAALAALERAGV